MSTIVRRRGPQDHVLASEIVDIRQLGARDFAPLLDVESRAWREGLRWDFTSSARLISTCLREKRISGYALVIDGSVKGYCFFFCDGDKGLIGDLFAECAASDPNRSLPLLERSIESLVSSRTVRRVEAQLPHFGYEQLNPCFHAHCFQGYRRRFMSAPLRKHPSPLNHSARSPHGGAPKGLEAFQDFGVQPWERKHDRAASELLYNVYQRHVDAAINDQYSSPSGTSRLLENIVLHRGCGEYLPSASLVAVHRSTQKLAAILAFTAIQPKTAHIPQIAVAREFQGIGLGKTLIELSLADRAREGYEEVSLTVTDLNEGAVRLYERLGFQTLRSFGAFVWNRAGQRII